MKIYISGKMTGMREEDSRALFRCGCSSVECCGHEPINPCNVNEYMPNATYEELMQDDLRIIRADADALFVLANYHTSAGAHREIAEAITKGIPVYYESNISEFWHRCFVNRAESPSEWTLAPEEVEEPDKLIMGFPRDYKLIGTQAEQKKFIGNAVETNTAKAKCRATALAVAKMNIKQLIA